MKRGMFVRNGIFIFILLFTAIVFATVVIAPLECGMRQAACLAGETDMLHTSNYSNAHAQLATQADYNWKVCCKLNQEGADTLNTICNGNEDSKVTSLSSATNAHVERPGETDYPNDVCISAAIGSVICSQKLEPCSPATECLFSQSNVTNAHVGECGSIANDPYLWRTCCRYYPGECGGLGEPCCAGVCSVNLYCENNVCVPGPNPPCGDFFCDVSIGEDNPSDPDYCPMDCGFAGQATVWGTVTNVSGGAVPNTRVTVVGKNSTLSNASGYYEIQVKAPPEFSPYDITASNPSYETVIEDNVILDYWDSVNLDFTLLKYAEGCNEDCTKADGLCHAGCDGKGLCSYTSMETADACDLAAPGIITDPSDPSKQIVCCAGGSYTPVQANIKVLCGGNTLSVKIPVLFKGKIINMVLTVFEAVGCEVR